MSNPFTGNMYENSEKHKQVVQRLSKLPQNKECADCDAKSPGWASWNLGVFICIKCAGIHRKLGTHISQVRSATLDKWTQQQAENMERVGGNVRANNYYERNKPDNLRKPSESDDVFTKEKFIRSKYEKKIWVEKGTSLFDDNISNDKQTPSPTISATSTTKASNPVSTSSSNVNSTQTAPRSNLKPVSQPSQSQRSIQQGPSLIEFESDKPSKSSNNDLLDLISRPSPLFQQSQQSQQTQQTQQVLQTQQFQQKLFTQQQFTQQAQYSQPQYQNINSHLQNSQQQSVQNDLLIDETKERNMNKASIMGLFDAPRPIPNVHPGMQPRIAPPVYQNYYPHAPIVNQPMYAPMGPMMNVPQYNFPQRR